MECELLEALYVETVGGDGMCRAFMFVFSRHFAVILIGPNCVAPYVLCICIVTEHENQISKVSGYESVLK
jgi:hypothetical protein